METGPSVTTKPGRYSVYSQPLLVMAGILAMLIYVGALLSPTYFDGKLLAYRPLAVFLTAPERPSTAFFPYRQIASWIGMAAGVLAVLFGLFILIKTRTAGSGKILASALITGSFGFALLHYFPFVLELKSSLMVADALTVMTGTVLVIMGIIFLVRWSSAYPKPLTVDEYRLHKFKRFGFRENRIQFRCRRWLKLQLLRLMRHERRMWQRILTKRLYNIVYGKGRYPSPLVNNASDTIRFLHRAKSNGWLLAVSSIAVLLAAAPFLLNRETTEFLEVVAFREATIGMFLFLMLGLVNEFFYVSYNASDEVGRRKIIWLWVAPTIFIVLLVLFWIIGSIGLFTENKGLVASALVYSLTITPTALGLTMVIALIVSVLARGAIDPRLAISRTTIYGIVAVLMISLFMALESLLSIQAALHSRFSGQTGVIAVGIGSTLIFGPLRNRVEAAVNGWIRRVLPPSNLVDGDKRHSAVAFNDLSGYTKLSESDERQALMLVAVFHREAFQVAANHDRRVVKTIGDAVMLEFVSVSELVAALQELHSNFAAACHRLRIGALPIHSGVHFGEVFRAHDGDIYGQTVNLASRLEGVAGGNEIVLSEAAWQELQNRDGFMAIGEHSLKNVLMPVKCFRLATS